MIVSNDKNDVEENKLEAFILVIGRMMQCIDEKQKIYLRLFPSCLKWRQIK